MSNIAGAGTSREILPHRRVKLIEAMLHLQNEFSKCSIYAPMHGRLAREFRREPDRVI
ncbi:hypothetical protein AB2N04_00505 (plasmid) [Nitratireductor sp. GISD-1A_MAKvit]|uniref:hypothetical protein n=1 Tax=Nitratireductor sp. GISD-1A_MAKvit TaxID=3234198 RepID=UPI003467CEA1